MTCDSYWPEHGECNGHGTCVLGQCECDSGWTGVSDVVGVPVMDCHVHTTTVAVLWGAQAVMTAILILICLRRFFRLLRWGVFTNAKYWRSLKTQAANRVLWLVTFIASCWLSLSIYKLSHLPEPPPAIGHDLVSTILYVTGIVGFYAMLLNNIWMWQAVVIPIHFMANHPQIQRVFFMVRVLGFFTFISTTASFHILYAIYVYPEYQNELGATFWLSRGGFLLAYVVTDQLFAKKLVKMLQDSFKSVATTRVATTGPTNNDEDMDKLVAGVKSYMGTNLFSGGVTIVICLVAGVWPFVRGLGAYIFPLSLTIPVLAGFSLMRTIPDSPGSYGRTTPSNSISRSRPSLNSPPSPQQKPLSPRQSQMTYGGRALTREPSHRSSQLVRNSSGSQENITNTSSTDDIVRPLPEIEQDSTVNTNFEPSAQSPSLHSKQSSFITLVPLSATSSSDSNINVAPSN